MVNKKTLKWNERCSISRSFYLLVYEKQEQTNWSVPVLAQKEGFEPSLRLSHTTPLAGEPLEPLGYFCTAQCCLRFPNAIILYHIFFNLSKTFCRKNEKR